MTSSFTTSTTFTRTHAKHLASKVISDLYQCSVLYDRPSSGSIAMYEQELIELLAGGYLETYEFGFKVNEKRLLSWHYTVGPDGGLHGDANAGAIYAKAAVESADYFNFVHYSAAWTKLGESGRATFKSGLDLQRGHGSPPSDGAGYWTVEHAYAAGGLRVERKVFRPW